MLLQQDAPRAPRTLAAFLTEIKLPFYRFRIAIFHWHIPSGHIVALGSTQLLTEMSTRNISWGGGKGGRFVWLTTLPPICADCLADWSLKLLEPLWSFQACAGIVCLWIHCILHSDSNTFIAFFTKMHAGCSANLDELLQPFIATFLKN